MSGLNLPFGLFITFDKDLREALELLRDRVPGARRFVAPRPAKRLLWNHQDFNVEIGDESFFIKDFLKTAFFFVVF